MYYVMRASAPSLHRESTDSLIRSQNVNFGPNFTSLWTIIVMGCGHDISAILYSRTPD